jgi:hypothetical protein
MAKNNLIKKESTMLPQAKRTLQQRAAGRAENIIRR